MPISKVTVQNYRSIERAEVEIGGFNVFVGRNNHGKTNFFEAINWFFTGSGSIDQIRLLHIPTKEVIVEIEVTDVQKEITEMKNEKNQATLMKQLEGMDRVTIRRSSKDPKKRFLIIGGEEVTPGTGFDTALNDFLPKVEFVHTKLSLSEVAGYKKTSPIGLMLSGVLTEILSEQEEYKNFQTEFDKLFGEKDSKVRVELDNLGNSVAIYLRKQFNGAEVEFRIASPQFEDLLKNFETDVDDGVKTSAEEKGDGMQRAIMLAIIQAYAEYRKKNSIGKNFLFLIDEGELHLHPAAQRELKRALLDIAKQGDQVLLNTHSSVLVADDATEQKIFKVEKISLKTEISEVDGIEKAHLIYELLGGSPSDLLLPKNFVVVEGKSEYNFIKEVIKRFYPTEFQGLQIIFAGGDIEKQEKTMYDIHETLKPLCATSLYKDTLMVLCDAPKTPAQEAAMKTFKESYPYIKENERLFTLPTHTLEEYYPAPYKKTEAEIKTMQENGEKASWALHVGKEITKEAFEKDMNVILETLQACKRLAYA